METRGILRYLTLFFALIFCITYVLQGEFSDFKSKEIVSIINYISLLLGLAGAYSTIMAFDIATKTLLRTKILFYILIAATVGVILYALKDGWAIITAVYVTFAAVLHFIVMYALRKYRLPREGIRLRTEFYALVGLALFILSFSIAVGQLK
jgi:hypothetical protein